MRILQICSARYIGGGERYLADLSNLLAESGQEIFCALPSDAPLINELQNISKDNFLFTNLRNSLDVFSAIKLAAFVRQNRIQIVHAHLGRDYPLAAIASKLTNTPFVLTRHVLFPLKRFNKFILRKVEGIIAPSNSVADALKQQNLFPAEKIQVIHYSVDTKHFSPSQGEQNSFFRVGTIGQFSPIKGQPDFIRAANLVLQKRPNVEFEIVGEDKSKSGENITAAVKLISDLKLENKIRLLGWKSDVRPFLHSLDLFVSPSHYDSFGLAIAEAMACGIPTVAAKTAGAQEIIENNESGVLTEIGNPENLAVAILDLINDDEKRKRLAENGRRRIENNFSLEKMVAETVRFYETILRKNTD